MHSFIHPLTAFEGMRTSNFRPLFHAASSLFLVPPVQSSCKKSESADAAAAVWCPFAAPHCAFVSRVGPPRQGCRCCQNPKEHIFGFSARIPPLAGVTLAPSPIRNTHRHRHTLATHSSNTPPHSLRRRHTHARTPPTLWLLSALSLLTFSRSLSRGAARLAPLTYPSSSLHSKPASRP